MPRRPTVEPELIRELITKTPRPSAREVAGELSELLGRPVAASLVSAVIDRYRDQWDLDEAPVGGGKPSMDYRHERDLSVTTGAIDPLQRQLRCWERMWAREPRGIPKTDYDTKILTWGWRLLVQARVVDVDDTGKWFIRPAWPWELGYLWAKPRPDDVVMVEHLAFVDDRDPEVTVNGMYGTIVINTFTDDHREMWKQEFNRLIRG